MPDPIVPEVPATPEVPEGNSPAPLSGAEAIPPAAPSAADDTLPFDQHPKWQAARQAEKQLTELLASKGFDSIEDLTGALDQGKNLTDALSGKDLEKLMEKATTLEEYERIWAEQERTEQLKGETTEQTIARLEKEKQELQDSIETDKSQMTAAQEAIKAVEKFNTDVNTLVVDRGIPKEYQGFATALLGADNPMLDADITDAKAFNSTADSMLGMISKFEAAVLAKHNITPPAAPPTPPVDGGVPPAPMSQQEPIKNLAAAKKIFLDRMLAARNA